MMALLMSKAFRFRLIPVDKEILSPGQLNALKKASVSFSIRCHFAFQSACKCTKMHGVTFLFLPVLLFPFHTI